MNIPARISAQAAYDKLQSGKALLVCAYEDTQMFVDNQLEGAITWQSFKSRLKQMDKNDEVIFYCA